MEIVKLRIVGLRLIMTMYVIYSIAAYLPLLIEICYRKDVIRMVVL
jgi:hypothetical protein